VAGNGTDGTNGTAGKWAGLRGEGAGMDEEEALRE